MDERCRPVPCAPLSTTVPRWWRRANGGVRREAGNHLPRSAQAGRRPVRQMKDNAGAVIGFRTRRDAEQATNHAEAAVRAGRRTVPPARDGSLAAMLFGAYANCWYAGLDLAASTMQNYRRLQGRRPLRLWRRRVDAVDPVVCTLRVTVAVDRWCRRCGLAITAAGREPR